MACPGSVALTCGLPEQTSDFADEGSVAHELAARCFRYGYPATHWLDEQFCLREGGKQWTFTQDMCDHVQTYVDYVHASAKELGGEILSEQRVSLERTLGLAEQGGTSDAVILNVATGVVKIIDLKFGRGEKVDASYDGKLNPQLGLYALGVLETITDLFGPVKKVQLAIVQPRLDHISEFEPDLDELGMLGINARNAVVLGTEAMVGDPAQYLHASEKACRWCPIKADCPKLRELVAGELASEFEVATTGTLSERYEQLELIEQYCTATRAALLDAIKAGRAPVGPDGRPYKLVAGRGGNRTWKDARMAGDVLAGLLGPAAYEPPTVITPAVADKALNKGRKVKTAMWNDFVAPLVTQPPGKPIIAYGSDERPEYTSATQEEFNV